jgi:UDP-N-acetylmuramoyl-tripeptide--D-alanyl-D-alanine ligase
MKATFRRLIARLLERQVRRLIARHHLKVVAVGGSVGKTSTKLFIATVLGQKYRVLAHQSNYNTEIGLPLSIFDLRVPGSLFNPFAWIVRLIQTERAIRHYPYDVIVVELGTDHPGEIPAYLRYLQPHIGVETAVTPEHMAGFPGGMDQVAAEELALAAASHVLVANYDDIRAADRHRYIDPHPRHHYYGLSEVADYRVQIHHTDPVAGTTFTLTHAAKARAGHSDPPRHRDFTVAVYGAHSAKAVVAAIAVGELMSLTPAQIEAGVAAIRPVSGRMRAFAGVSGSVIVDDTYNSSPEAVVAALTALATAPVKGRRLALLGSMNELGADSPRYHEEAGTAAAGVDLLVTVGADANRYLGPAAVRAGLDPTRYRAADSPYAAGDYLRLILQPGDVVIAKGSQNGVFCEEALKFLLADPADTVHLVRQSPAWLRTKARQFPDAPVSQDKT